MMKKVSLSQFLSRSPRHGTNNNTSSNNNSSGRRRRSASNNANGAESSSSALPLPPLPTSSSSTTSASTSPSPTYAPSYNTADSKIIIKKKSKSGILQTLKKKISGKLDNFQSATTSPKKSKSFEGLSNSFGDSFSQSVSEESSSDGLNACGGQSLKGKHSKRAIRPMHTPVTRQNSLSHVLTDSETKVMSKLGRDESVKATNNLTSYNKPSYVSDVTSPSYSVKTNYGEHNHVSKVPQVLVENVSAEEQGQTLCTTNKDSTLGLLPIPSNIVSETSSPQSSRACDNIWEFQNTNLDASKRSLAEELFRLAKFGWYWGPITRPEAEEKLIDQPDGAFLVRDSSDDKYLLSLSFRSFNKTLHTRIEHSNGWFSFYPHPEHEGHTSLVGLIEHCMSHSESGVFCYSRARVPGSPSFPVRLTKAVSRFTQVRSLQYLCRFVIRQYTRVDHIQALPLPSRIKGYLQEAHF